MIRFMSRTLDIILEYAGDCCQPRLNILVPLRQSRFHPAVSQQQQYSPVTADRDMLGQAGLDKWTH